MDDMKTNTGLGGQGILRRKRRSTMTTITWYGAADYGNFSKEEDKDSKEYPQQGRCRLRI